MKKEGSALFERILVAPLVAMILSPLRIALTAREDPWGALNELVTILAHVLLILAPFVFLVSSISPRKKYLILAPAGLILIILGLTVFSCISYLWWILLVITSIVGCVYARKGWMRIAVFLPLLTFTGPPFKHILDQRFYDSESMARTCSLNDGNRPKNVIPAMMVGVYYSLTALSPNQWLLTADHPSHKPPDQNPLLLKAGEEKVLYSWWVRKGINGELLFDRVSSAMGCFWRGCMLNGSIWLADGNGFVGVTRKNDSDKYEDISRFPIPDLISTELGVDVSDTACDPDRGVVYTGQAFGGVLWAVEVQDGTTKRWDLGYDKLALFPRMLADGRLLLTSFGDLFVFDPDKGEIVERQPAGFFIHGADVCRVDGDVVVAELAGRIRLFSPTQKGSYRLKGSIGLHGPRRVVFSPDCRFLAVTSWNDQNVFIVDRELGKTIRTFNVGPVIRDVTFIGPQEIAVADACTVTILNW